MIKQAAAGLRSQREAARYERRDAAVPLIIYWRCASLVYEMEAQIKDSTSGPLLESFNKGDERSDLRSFCLK